MQNFCDSFPYSTTQTNHRGIARGLIVCTPRGIKSVELFDI